MNLYGFVGNDGVGSWDYLGMYNSIVDVKILGASTPYPQPWPDLYFEGMDCVEGPAKLEKLNLEVIMPTHKTKVDYVNVELWVNWSIKGSYIGPRWTYATCTRDAPQPFTDYPTWSRFPGQIENAIGHIPGCDDNNCVFNACSPQLVQVVFHFLSCECEIDETSWLATGKRVWTRKVYEDGL
jgi:hypothetical protein